MGIAPTGNRIAMTNTAIMRLAGGKCVECHGKEDYRKTFADWQASTKGLVTQAGDPGLGLEGADALSSIENATPVF